jgi:hypothetical protein
MPNEFASNDSQEHVPPKNGSKKDDAQHIWKNQTTEAFKMSADQLRTKSQQREKKARWEAVYSMIGGLILFLFFVRTFARVHQIIPRAGFGVLALWCIYFVYQAYKWLWPAQPAPDATVDTTLRSYRSELEKHRDYTRNLWRRAGLPFCVLGSALVMAPTLIKSIDVPRFLEAWAPVLVLFAVWLPVFFFVRRRRWQKLQQEIDELRGFERQNQA